MLLVITIYKIFHLWLHQKIIVKKVVAYVHTWVNKLNERELLEGGRWKCQTDHQSVLGTKGGEAHPTKKVLCVYERGTIVEAILSSKKHLVNIPHKMWDQTRSLLLLVYIDLFSNPSPPKAEREAIVFFFFKVFFWVCCILELNENVRGKKLANNNKLFFF